MHLRFIQLAFFACISFLLVHSTIAEPQPTVPPIKPPPTPTIPPIPTPTPPGNITIDPRFGVNPGEVIPVVVTYDAGQEARARIFRDVMDYRDLRIEHIVAVASPVCETRCERRPPPP